MTKAYFGVNGQSVVKRTKNCFTVLLATLNPKLNKLTCPDLSEMFSRRVEDIYTLIHDKIENFVILQFYESSYKIA